MVTGKEIGKYCLKYSIICACIYLHPVKELGNIPYRTANSEYHWCRLYEQLFWTRTCFIPLCIGWI